MGKAVLTSAWTPKMLDEAYVYFKEIPVEIAVEKWREMKNTNPNTEVSIGHEGTARLFEELGFEGVKFDRKPIRLRDGDHGIVCFPSFRVPEGKVYSYDELKEIKEKGMVKCYEFYVFNPDRLHRTLSEL